MKIKLAYLVVTTIFTLAILCLGWPELVRPLAEPTLPNVENQVQDIAQEKSSPESLKVTRLPLRRIITAEGIVRPEELVEIGAQVTGMIQEFGHDPSDPNKLIDNGSVVQKGTVLAKITPTIYQAQADYAKASLARAKADLLQLRAKCDRAKNEWCRAQSLLPEKAISMTDYDLLSSNFNVAQANLAIGQAAIEQCQAQLRVAQTYLDYTVIKSPIDGVVVDRRVSIGQTVMAAFNVPGLFVIAKDLRQVEIWASVKETDIGYIKPGQPAQFTVDAYPGEQFEGHVTEILLNPTKDSDCMTYTVVVAPECCRTLLPYLSAKLRFEVNRRS